MEIQNSGLFIPVEIWLRIFRYTDTQSFNKILDCIKEIDKKTYDILFRIICWDLVKHNKKIKAIVELINDFSYFRLKNNYLQFRNLWVNNDGRDNKKKGILSFITSDRFAYSFKKLILDNKLIKNKKDEKMFINLTHSYSDGYHEETYQKKIKFHNNHIDLECVVNEILG
jgi:hypothetical protein